MQLIASLIFIGTIRFSIRKTRLAIAHRVFPVHTLPYSLTKNLLQTQATLSPQSNDFFCPLSPSYQDSQCK